jgi:acyl-CoA thioesterase
MSSADIPRPPNPTPGPAVAGNVGPNADKPRAPNRTPGPTIAVNGDANADMPRTPNLLPMEAQQIAERAADTLVVPGQAVRSAGESDASATTAATTPNARISDAATGNGRRGTNSGRDAAAETADQPNPEHAQRLAERAAEALFARDTSKELLGIRIISVWPGGARLGMTVRHDMVNGHRTCHGGLIFSLADSAFAAACNSHNESNVAAAASIDFLAPGFEGDELLAEASEIWRAGRTGLYEIKVTNQRGELIALFRGRSHRIGGTVTTD